MKKRLNPASLQEERWALSLCVNLAYPPVLAPPLIIITPWTFLLRLRSFPLFSLFTSSSLFHLSLSLSLSRFICSAQTAIKESVRGCW